LHANVAAIKNGCHENLETGLILGALLDCGKG
jgi:hypothetical protein